jgi:hypothetical protein
MDGVLAPTVPIEDRIPTLPKGVAFGHRGGRLGRRSERLDGRGVDMVDMSASSNVLTQVRVEVRGNGGQSQGAKSSPFVARFAREDFICVCDWLDVSAPLHQLQRQRLRHHRPRSGRQLAAPAETLPHDLMPQRHDFVVQSRHHFSLDMHLLLLDLAPQLELFDESLLSVAALCRGLAVQFELAGMFIRARLDASCNRLLPPGRGVSWSVGIVVVLYIDCGEGHSSEVVAIQCARA